MPLYEYQCDACSHRFERIQKFSDPPVETCPTCGGAVRKLLSAPAIQFKGSGWYVTDYAKKSSTDGGKTSNQQSSTNSGESSGTQSTDKGSTAGSSGSAGSSGASSSSAPGSGSSGSGSSGSGTSS